MFNYSFIYGWTVFFLGEVSGAFNESIIEAVKEGFSWRLSFLFWMSVSKKGMDFSLGVIMF